VHGNADVGEANTLNFMANSGECFQQLGLTRRRLPPIIASAADGRLTRA
jgi:hypothetical protein